MSTGGTDYTWTTLRLPSTVHAIKDLGNMFVTKIAL